MAVPFSFLRHSVRLRSSCFNSCLWSSVRSQHSLGNELSQVIENRNEISSDDENNVKYPVVKPKYPPGKWGEMDHKYAWRWNDAKEHQLNIPDVQGRIIALVEKEMSSIQVEPLNDHPASLEFRQYATKTKMIPWEEIPLYKNEHSEVDLSFVVNQLGRDISDFLLLEHEVIQRQSTGVNQTHLSQSLMRIISNSLITHLGNQFPHLKTCQYDEDVLVRSLWDRHGIERKRQKYTSDPDVLVYDTVQDQRIVSEGYFQAMLRSHQPLPMCVPRDEGISVNSPTPQIKFRPSVYGHEKVQKKKIDNILAGHRLGDPCEFGLVGLLSTCDTQSVEERIGAQTARDCRLALGLTMTFSWLAAQAANQGFSHLIDLTYPLTSQTILTDGQMFSFLAYQLNTLELWKDDEASPMVNLCWHSKEIPLYHSVENGKVNELNEDVLQTLVKIFTLEPKDRGYDMKPTIKQHPEDHYSKQDYVPKRVVVEEVVEEEQYIVS